MSAKGYTNSDVYLEKIQNDTKNSERNWRD